MFSLNERIATDTLPVGDLETCRVLLMNDSNYPWLILVPRIEDAVEVHDLTAEQQQKVWAEVAETGARLKEFAQADKINIATLGNVVAQMHIHVVARKFNDISWPKPVWGTVSAKPYDLRAGLDLAAKLKAHLKAR